MGCGIAVPRMSRMRDINGAPGKAHLIPTKYCDSRSWPRLRAGNHSNQRHEYDSLGPRILIIQHCMLKGNVVDIDKRGVFDGRKGMVEISTDNISGLAGSDAAEAKVAALD
ncbi:hypothetical protein Syun_007128 [Stephania yunnanensis]|uniref:Uncharacterized protein n=1 Tax=Stephania yunnanensis TaxID=152371 RepID=A0AAP0KZN4_9MAGN